MISYKNWKQLNESMGHLTPLGIRKPLTIGELQSRWNEMGMMPMKSKKMSMGGMSMGTGMMDDEEDMPMPPMKGKGKKKKGPPMPPPEEDDDLAGLGDEEDIEGDEEDIEGDDEDLDLDDDDLEDDEDDLEDDEEDLGDDEEDLGDDEEDLGDDDDMDPSLAGDMGDDMGGDDMGMPMPPPPMPKKKGKGLDGAAMMLKGASRMVKGMKEAKECPKGCDCEKCNHKMKYSKKSKKNSKCMTKEDSDFVASLKDQCGMSFFDINDDGTFKEDALFTPYDPNANLAEDEPQAGEVGYAPQQRVGGELGSMAEWTKKHRRKINEAIKAKDAPRKSKGRARKAR